MKARRNRENLFSKISEQPPVFCKDSERWGSSQTCPDRILSSVNGERRRRAGLDFELVSPFSGSGIICKYSWYSSFIGLFSGPLFVVRRSSYVLGFRFGSGPAFLYGKMAEAGNGSQFFDWERLALCFGELGWKTRMSCPDVVVEPALWWSWRPAGGRKIISRRADRFYCQ